MQFVKIKNDGGWTQVAYMTTWSCGYDFMLDAVQTVIDTDFRDDTQRVAVAKIAGAENTEILDAVKAAGMELRNCSEAAEECGVLTVAGISRIMECPVQIVFFNQTNKVRLFCPVPDYFKKHGDRVFDNYMDSIEIKAYCRAAERKTVQKLKGK